MFCPIISSANWNSAIVGKLLLAADYLHTAVSGESLPSDSTVSGCATAVHDQVYFWVGTVWQQWKIYINVPSEIF